MKPKEVLEKWIDCFNKADAYHIAELYATNAVTILFSATTILSAVFQPIK